MIMMMRETACLSIHQCLHELFFFLRTELREKTLCASHIHRPLAEATLSGNLPSQKVLLTLR